MTTIFLDTVGLIARWDEDDQWHLDATVAFLELVDLRPRLVTTTLVLCECGNAAARRPYRSEVVTLLESLQGTKDLIVPSEDDWRIAWENYAHGNTDSAGIVDEVSFAVMRRLGISKVLTNDKHFAAAGFEILF